MQAMTVASPAQRLHALTVVSTSLHAELKEVAANLNAFSESPKGHALSPSLGLMYRAASFCGFWGVANYIGALRELAQGIENVPPSSVDRAEYLERVKALAGGINALGLYLRDLSAGTAVSYAALNEHFARVIRKARPKLLEMTPQAAAPVLFMPAPPSLEVDAHWVPAPEANRESLLAALESLLNGGVNEAALRRAAAANPYRTLSGLLEAAACQHASLSKGDAASDVVAEVKRLHALLSAGEPFTPPTPDAFLFSRLMYALATSTAADAETKGLRKRYALTKPGASLASMHDVARRFSEGMKKLQDAYLQATLSKTPTAITKMATQVSADGHRLESAAFTTFAATLAELTRSWGTEAPDMAGWTRGAALVLLMRESADTWGRHEPQESLAGLADLMAATGEIFPSTTMQATMRGVAVQKAVDALMTDFAELNRHIESALRSVGHADLEGPQAHRVAEVLGGKVRVHMTSVAGVLHCMMLPQAALFAEQLQEAAARDALWASNAERLALFEAMARLNLFLARLRPGSMLDMEPDEQSELAADVDATAETSTAVVEEPVPAAADSVLQSVDEPVAEASAAMAMVEVAPAVASEVEVAVSDSSAEESVEAEAADGSVSAPHIELPSEVSVESAVEVALVDETPELTAQHAVESADVEPVAAPAEPHAEVVVDAAETVEQNSLDVASVDAVVAEARADEPPLVDDIGADFDDPFAFDIGDELTEAMPTAVSNVTAEELEREFIDAQEGRSTSLDTSDHELLNIMFEESWQCMEAIDIALAAAQRGGDEANGTVPEARRHIHTLKGVCRTCGLDGPGATLHAMEDRLEVMPDDGVLLSGLVAPFQSAMALVRSQLEAARTAFYNTTSQAPAAEPVAAELVVESPVASAAELVDEVVAEAAVELTATAPVIEAAEEVAAQVVETAPAAAGEIAPVEGARFDAAAKSTPAPAARAAAGTVRIPVHLAGRMGDASGQVLTASRRAIEDQAKVGRSMRELDENLRRMAPAIRELEMMAATSIASSQHQGGAQGFDPLELDRYTQMQDLVRRLVEAFEDTVNSASSLSDGLKVASNNEQQRAELSDELQRGASELLLVPVATQQTRLERVVAKACSDAGREAVLVIEQGSRVPAAAIDKLMPVFEHILRNAIAHGIESAAARVATGKPAVGRIVIGMPMQESTEGGVVRIAVRDDGGGIDLERVLAIAVKRGLVKAGVKLTDNATRELLFMPGFSTAGSVSELAGRGVGLDVVRTALSSLGGVVTVYSEKGKGTEFTLTLPTDAASMSVVPVTAGGFKCLLPLVLVRRIVPVSAGAEVVVDATNSKATISGVDYELIDMVSRVPAVGGASRAGRGHLVLMKESNVTKAVLVDSVGQQTRVVVKPLGPFVRDIPGMVAGTTMAAGGAGLVVNPLQLAVIASSTNQVRASDVQTRVMVVDDSSTVRLVTSRFLKRSGYAVETARDGLDALQQLAKGTKPDVFLFDLEMPGMGGFELIAEVRRKAEFRDTPIVVITSRTAEKHRERATQLGATAYLAKPYEDAQLHEVLSRLVGIPA
jgi:chemotaxis protein histidine kinase CheA/ActR/RegA family two-component response regulator